MHHNNYCQCRHNPRVVDRFEPSEQRGRARKCEIPGCNQTTKEGKLYCSDHVDMTPYARQILARLEKMEADDTLAARKRLSKEQKESLSLSESLDEIMLVLKSKGPMTLQRLAREVNKKQAVVKNYINMLKSRQLVRTTKNKRGSEVVQLTNLT